VDEGHERRKRAAVEVRLAQGVRDDIASLTAAPPQAFA
jgi:hypothetical protein